MICKDDSEEEIVLRLRLKDPNKEGDERFTYLDTGQFTRVPLSGEYICTDIDSVQQWYKVEFVVHCLFKNSVAAEVYAIKVEKSDVTQKFNDKLNPSITFI